METTSPLTAMQLRLPVDMLRDLDTVCADLRRQTGDAVTRTSVIRQAVADLIKRHQSPAMIGNPFA